MRDEMKRLIELDRERTLFSHIGALLGWDQETYLPERGVEERAEQLALIEGMAHEKAVRPEIGDLLEALEADKDLEDVEKAYLRVSRRDSTGKENCLSISSPKWRGRQVCPRLPGSRRGRPTTSPASLPICKK